MCRDGAEARAAGETNNKTADNSFLQNQPVTACGINNSNFLEVAVTRHTEAPADDEWPLTAVGDDLVYVLCIR